MAKMAVLENLGIKKNNRAIRTVKKQVIQQKLILDISHKFENQKKQILEKREEQNISFCPICRNCVSTRVFCETCNKQIHYKCKGTAVDQVNTKKRIHLYKDQHAIEGRSKQSQGE